MVQCLQQENKESVNFPYNLKQQEEGLNVLEEVFVTISSVQESDGIRDVYKLLKKKDFSSIGRKRGSVLMWNFMQNWLYNDYWK